MTKFPIKDKPNPDLSIDMTPDDFKGFTPQSDPDLATIFGEDKLRILYIYRLENLIKNDKRPTLRFSQNIIKLGFIDVKSFKKTDAYEVSDFNLQLASTLSSNPQDNTTEYDMDDSKSVVFQDTSLLNDYSLHVVSINEPLTEDNKDQLYIIETYNQRFEREGLVVTKGATLTRLRNFKMREGNPIIPILQAPLASDTQIIGVKIKAPKTMLFGNIKILGEIDDMEVYPKLLIKGNNIAFPLFTMPIETEPKVRLLQQWFSDQILPWNLTQQFKTQKSLLDLIAIGGGTESRKLVINNARIISAWLATIHADGKPGWPTSDVEIPEASPGVPQDRPEGIFKVSDESYFAVSSSIGDHSRQYITNPSKNIYRDVEIEIKDAPKIDSLQKVLLDMLTYTYNFNRNFDGATYENGNATNPIAKLRQKFEGQKPDEVITNLFNQWKLDYPDYVSLPQVQIFKQIVAMLSKYIYSNMAINKGLNDDNKVLLPYYFELKSKPIHSNEGEIWEFKDVEVTLNSLYFDIKFLDVLNKDISSNQLFKLEDNQFNWLSITNQLESNNIPSLIPGDLTLNSGEYGKYFTKIIIDKDKVETALNLYGINKSQLYSKLDWYNEILKINIINDFELVIENPISKVNRIEMSGIFGNGNYDISLVTKDATINLNSINLFSRTNETISYINIEI